MRLPDALRSLTTNTPLLLLAGGFVLFAVLAYLRVQETGGAAPPAWTSVEEAVAPAAAPAPSADNVDPGFHARLMTLRDRLATSPEDTTRLLEAARLQQDAHQLEESAEHYERFLALAPRNHQVWLDLANVYAGLARWDDARRVSEQMLEHYPDDPSAMYNLGAIAANEGDTDEARRWWTPVRDGSDATLAAQAETSLAQLDALASAPAARPTPTSASPSRPIPNPHAGLSQPVVAHRVSALDGTE